MYKLEGPKQEQTQLFQSLEQCIVPDLTKFSIHTVSVVLKILLHDYYAPLLGYQSYTLLVNAFHPEEFVPEASTIIVALEDDTRALLLALLDHFAALTAKSSQDFTSKTLSRLIGASLSRKSELDEDHSCMKN